MHAAAGLSLALLALLLGAAAADGIGTWPAAGDFAPPDNSSWVTFWRDEFRGPTLNRSKWTYELGDGCQYISEDQRMCGWGNGEYEYYTNREANVRIENGSLVIEARKEVQTQTPFTDIKDRLTSGRIKTLGRLSFMPGVKWRVIKVAARIKLPFGKGLWPALWMLPSFDDTCLGCGRLGRWATSGEIDIMESANNMSFIQGTIHFGGSWPNNTFLTDIVGPEEAAALHLTPFANRWHVYAVEWEQTEIRWLVDGKVYATQRSRSVDPNGWFSSAPGAEPNSPFDAPFHIVINMALGGGYVNQNLYPGENKVLSEAEVGDTLATPKKLLVDWVRVSGKK